MGKQVKKKARSFSLTDEEFDDLLGRMAHHGFEDRNLYLLALIEADQALGLETVLDHAKQKVLRIGAQSEGRLAADPSSAYRTSAPGGKKPEEKAALRKRHL